MIEVIDSKYINRSLISGSGDSLRAALEQSWEVVENEVTGDTKLEFNGNTDFADWPMIYFVGEIQENTDLRTEINELAVNPNFLMPIRLIGNPDYIVDDIYWRARVYGGVHSTSSYEGIYNDYVHHDLYHEDTRTYNAYSASIMSQYDSLGFITTDVTPSYNFFIPEYQAYISEAYEPMLPNLYIYDVVANSSIDDVGDNVAPEILFLMTQGGYVEENIGLSDITNILSPTIGSSLPPVESLYNGKDVDGDGSDDIMVDRNETFRRYLSASYVRTSRSDPTNIAAATMQTNMFFDDEAAVEYLTANSSINRIKSLFPMSVSIKIPTAHDVPAGYESSQYNTFRDIIKDAGSVQIILAQLRQTFDTEGGTGLTTGVIKQEYFIADPEAETLKAVKDSTGQSYKTIDLNQFFLGLADRYAYPGRSCFVGIPNFKRIAAINDKSYFRFYNHKSVMTTILNHTRHMHDTYNAEKFETLQDFLDQAEVSKYHETIAYKIVKEIAATGRQVQTFWIYNDPELGNSINFTDTQVKYSMNYRYKIYQYKIVVGYRYKYSNLVVTRRFADQVLDDDGTTKYCLEFYDPAGRNTSDQLLETSDELSAENQFIDNNYQITDENRYLADFRLNWEPYPTIIEKLIDSKEVMLLDNPSHAVNVSPYQLTDNQKVVAFDVKVKAFQKTEIPIALGPAEVARANRYKTSYNMVEGSSVSFASRSNVSIIQMFRLLQRPRHLSDFGPVPYKEYNLVIPEPDMPGGHFSMAQCYDRLAINKKYYYAFRSVNFNSAAGSLSEIYEVELKTDGQHTYATFNTLSESDLEKDRTYIEPSMAMKKLFMLMPSVAQMQLNTSDVNFAEPAHTQIEDLHVGSANLEDPIWNKEFKFRLTSKKTGKKIDLNITYKVESE